jgi:hypothetical protein
MEAALWVKAGVVGGLLLGARFASLPEVRQNDIPVPKEVTALTGTFAGEWTMYGIDAKGQVSKRIGWTDVIKVENPTAQKDRAFVTSTDEMKFEGALGPPRKYVVTEGYLLQPDGKLGDYFMESGGQVTRMQRLDKDTWAYSAPADARELAQLGFSNVISGKHVLLKVVGMEDGKETHRISRVTTVRWKDAEGKERTLQFVSLQGYHRKQ